MVGNGSWWAEGQVHHWQSFLEQAQGCLWSSGTLSSCPTPCPEEGNHLHGLAVRPQLLHLGNAAGREVKQEHRVCLPQSWLFVDAVGTDGSSVPTMALFFPLSYMIVRFLFHFLLLKSGFVPSSSNAINKVWECQSLLSFTGKIAKSLAEPQSGSSPRQGRPGIVGGAFFVNGPWVKFILIKFQKCVTDSMVELRWREGSRSILDVGGIAK